MLECDKIYTSAADLIPVRLRMHNGKPLRATAGVVSAFLRITEEFKINQTSFRSLFQEAPKCVFS